MWYKNSWFPPQKLTDSPWSTWGVSAVTHYQRAIRRANVNPGSPRSLELWEFQAPGQYHLYLAFAEVEYQDGQPHGHHVVFKSIPFPLTQDTPSPLGGPLNSENITKPLTLRLQIPEPNPFASHTTISYSLPHTSHVELLILDASGRLVSLLEKGRKEAGTYHLRWNARDMKGRKVPAGVYFCLLRLPQCELCRRLVIVH